MVKRKFKVGERYKCGMILDNGAVIEITEINGDFVSYKDVVRETFGRKVFEIGSIFSDNLEKVEKVESETIVIYRNDNKVVALDKSTGEKAEANCNPADEFDFRTGAKLAFNRLMGEDVKPDNGVREVKRKAKVGEYVKVVNEKSIFNTYKNGEIFKVTYVTKSGCICKNSEKQYGLWHEEYVALENYKPEEKKEDDSEIHVGDMVEVTRSGDCYSTYDTWSGLGSYRQNFVNGVYVEDGMVAKVLNIAKHDRLHNFRLALIQNPKTSQVFIINIDGIKNVER